MRLVERGVSCSNVVCKMCLSLWMVLGTTWLIFLCVVIGRLCMFFYSFQIQHYPCSGSFYMCLVFIDWFPHGACGCRIWVSFSSGMSLMLVDTFVVCEIGWVALVVGAIFQSRGFISWMGAVMLVVVLIDVQS